MTFDVTLEHEDELSKSTKLRRYKRLIAKIRSPIEGLYSLFCLQYSDISKIISNKSLLAIIVIVAKL